MERQFAIQAFKARKNLPDNAALQAYFNQRLQQILDEAPQENDWLGRNPPSGSAKKRGGAVLARAFLSGKKRAPGLCRQFSPMATIWITCGPPLFTMKTIPWAKRPQAWQTRKSRWSSEGKPACGPNLSIPTISNPGSGPERRRLRKGSGRPGKSATYQDMYRRLEFHKRRTGCIGPDAPGQPP